MHKYKFEVEDLEIKKLKNIRSVKETLMSKFIPMLNQIHFLKSSSNLIDDQMNLLLAPPAPVPSVNPHSFVSDEVLHSITNLNHLISTKEKIKVEYTPEMVELIQTKLKELFVLMSKNEKLQMPQGSLLEMIE